MRRPIWVHRGWAIRRVLLPLLLPAIFASAVLVFASTVDDFVIVEQLSSTAATQPMSVLIYANVHGGLSGQRSTPCHDHAVLLGRRRVDRLRRIPVDDPRRTTKAALRRLQHRRHLRGLQMSGGMSSWSHDEAVRHVTGRRHLLDIQAGEFFSLLGPAAAERRPRCA